jgi:TRAP-type C4-dicarboxylate transport system permease small subunit
VIHSIERGLLALERALLSALLVVLVVLSFLQVVLRGGFSAGLFWADVFLRHLVLLIGFLGAGVAVAEGKMFSFDAAAHVLKGRLKRTAALLVNLFAAAASAALASAAWRFFLDEYRSKGVLFSAFGISVPQWVFVACVPFGFALIALHHLLRAARPEEDAR